MSNKIDRTSGLLGLTSTGFGVALFYKQRIQGEPPSEALVLGFAVSILSLIAYDRWCDRLWPFEREGAPGAIHYGAAARRNPG